MRLRGVPTPPKYETGTVETCSSCGAMTVVGFYNFREPEIIFPNEELF